MGIEYADVRVFSSLGEPFLPYRAAPLMGNQHHVVCYRLSADLEKTWSMASFFEYCLALSKTMSIVVVALWLGKSPQLRFFQQARSILRCGSGTLASATFLEISPMCLTIESSVEKIQLTRLSENFASMEVEPLPIQTGSLGNAWHRVVDQAIIDGFYIGGECDYCALVLTSAKNLESAQVDLVGLVRLSQRALILTAPSGSDACDFVLRYFAPQYGINEDSSTGSANAQVAHYWQKKLKKQSVRSLQLSAAGGFFEISVNNTLQRLTGSISSFEV